MISNFFRNIKFNRLSYLLEIIELRDIKQKLKAYNKLRKMDITEEMGHLILDKIELLHDDNYSDFNITISLISLIFKNYYPSYSDKIFKLYPKLTYENKKEILGFLSITENDEAIILYRDLLSKYYSELENIPIGTLSNNKGNYNLLFPELYKTLKLEIDKNNVIVLLNDFVNGGVVPIAHLKKHKKLIQDNIIRIFKEGLKYKYKDDSFMGDKEYINLRIFLEAAINIEFYVSNKDTKALLEKLLKRKDNQLKLFILDNYIRKKKDISKINLNTIARDPLSRYPLYSFLVFNKLEKLMPKKYKNNKALSESDLLINFSIFYSYGLTPFDFELLEEKEFDDYIYYIYKFKTEYNYNEEVVDPATDYILKNSNIDKKLIDDGNTVYLGISGGFKKDHDPSLIEKELKELKVAKFEEDYEKIVKSLLASEKTSKKEIEKIIKEKQDELKDKVEEAKEEVKGIEKDLDKAEKEIESNIEVKEDFFDKKEEKKEKKKHPILRFIFSFNTFLTVVCLLFVGAVVVLYLYMNNVDLFNIMRDKKNFNYVDTFKEYELHNEDKFREINYTDIFSQGEPDYYVLLFDKSKKSSYYPFIDKFVNNDYVIYYVDTSKEGYSNVFENNGTVFTITTDTFFRVTEGEYNFYIVGKTNILKEFKLYMKEIEKKEEEIAKQAEIEKQKQAKAAEMKEAPKEETVQN